MARQIIILNTTLTPDGYLEGTFAFWLQTPATLLPYAANTGLTSAVPDATAAEVQALQNGTVTEVIRAHKVPPAVTTAQIETALQASYSHAQADLNALAPAKRYTTGTWDGTTWTNMPA